MNPYNANPANVLAAYQNPTTQSLLDQLTGNTQYRAQSAYQQAQDALNQSQQAPNVQATAPENKGNWFSQLLPTAGSIVGGIGGGILGGLATPFTGGIVNPFTGAVAGAAAGSSVGKAGENLLEGQDVGKDIGNAAVEGAGGQLIGGAIGKVAGAAGKGVLGLIGRGAEGRAATATAAAEQAAQRAENQRIADTFGGVKTGQGNVGQALQHVNQFGFSTPTVQDLVNVGRTATGSNPETGIGVLNFYKQQALENAGGTVNLNNTMGNLEKTLATPEMQNNLGSLEPIAGVRGGLPKVPNNTASQIVQQVRNLLPGDTVGADGQLTRQLTPQEGVSLLSDIGKKIDATSNTKNALGVDMPEKVAENNVWKSLYNDVKTSVYDRPEVNAQVQGMQVGPEEQAVIDDAIKSNGITDPAQVANLKAHFVDTLNNAQSAADIMKAEQPFVNVSRVGSAATKDITSDVTSARGVRRANAGITPTSLGNGTVEPLTNVESAPKSSTMNSLIDTLAIGGAPFTGGASLLGLVPHAAKIATDPAVRDKAYQLLTENGVSKKVASALPGVLTGASQFMTHGDNFNPAPAGNTGGAMQSAPQMPMNNPNHQALQVASELLKQGMAGGLDPYLAQNYGGYLNNGESLLAQVLPNIQANASAQAALQGTQQAFNNAGGGQGLLPGLLAKLGGAFSGNAVSAYAQQRQQLADQLKVMGIPASAIPDVTDTSAAAQSQWQQLAQLIASGAGTPQSTSVLSALPIK